MFRLPGTDNPRVPHAVWSSDFVSWLFPTNARDPFNFASPLSIDEAKSSSTTGPCPAFSAWHSFPFDSLLRNALHEGPRFYGRAEAHAETRHRRTIAWSLNGAIVKDRGTGKIVIEFSRSGLNIFSDDSLERRPKLGLTPEPTKLRKIRRPRYPGWACRGIAKTPYAYRIETRKEGERPVG